MTARTAKAAGSGSDTILHVVPALVHPDPDQPRTHPDDELKASIADQGVLQPILVRPHPETAGDYLIIDGERRWRGATAADLSTIPIRVRTDLEDRGQRLLVQLAANTGKPLPPFDEARAWGDLRTLMGWSKLELAKAMGKSKSTVNDRLALLEIPSAWQLELQREGTRVQLSHAPLIHLYRDVPAQYHDEAVQGTLASYHANADGENGPISVRRFRQALFDGYKKFLHPLRRSEYGRGCAFNPARYTGPVVTVVHGGHEEGSYSKPEKFAADPEQWKPLVAEAKKRKREKESKSRSTDGDERASSQRDGKWMELPAGHSKRPRKSHDVPKGAVVLARNGTWEVDEESALDLDTLLARLRPEKLILETEHHYRSPQVITTDTEAVDEARAVYADRWGKRYSELRQAFLEKAGELAPRHAVSGQGAAFTVQLIANLETPWDFSLFGKGTDRHGNDSAAWIIREAARALDIDLPGNAEQTRDPERALTRNLLAASEATRILTLIAVAIEKKLLLPGIRLAHEQWEEAQRLKKRKVSWDAVRPAEGTPAKPSTKKGRKSKAEELPAVNAWGCLCDAAGPCQAHGGSGGMFDRAPDLSIVNAIRRGEAGPAKPAPEKDGRTAANVFSKIVRAQCNKSLIRKRVDQWPNDVVESMLRYATQQLPVCKGATHRNLLNDIAILTEAARVRGLAVPGAAEQEVPVPKAKDVDRSAIQAALEHDTAETDDESGWQAVAG